MDMIRILQLVALALGVKELCNAREYYKQKKTKWATFTVISLPVYLMVISAGWVAITAACIATVVIIAKHSVNYVRIWKGTEIGLRSTMKREHRVK